MESQSQSPSTPVLKILSVASIAAGIQFGWALQLSLLTPYVQLLGVPHTWAAFIWLCGPISGMLVQPIVGYQSDRTTSRFGRRMPFIFTGALFVAIAVILIGFAADLGHMSGDSLAKTTKPRAVAIFVVGFWILDVANNMLQGPCRALLADLSNGNEKMMRTANALYSFFMGVGNVLGYAAGSYKHLYKLFPFSKTTACGIYCANLKSCFFISVTLLLLLVFSSLLYVKEKQHQRKEEEPESASESPNGIGQLVLAFKSMKKPMWILLLVTCLNWIAWFPFLLFDTDWMGREIYGGDSKGKDPAQLASYDRGVRAGAMGLLVNSVVLGVVSLGMDTCSKLVGGTKRLWGVVNFVLAACLAMTVVITKVAESERRRSGDHVHTPHAGVRAAALAVFGFLGIPLAITFSVPFALASIFSSTSGSGQGLSLGVLNLSIVLPQMFVSVTSGPFDQLFGGGNLPAFVVGAIAAVASGILAMTWLPSPPSDAKPAIVVVASH